MVLALAALVVALPSALGLADDYFQPICNAHPNDYRCDNANPPRVKHRHTDTYGVYVAQMDADSTLRNQVRNARANWSERLEPDKTTLTLPEVDTVNGADINVNRQALGQTGAKVVIDNAGYHSDLDPNPAPATVSFNTYYSDGMGATEKQGRACQAFGQVLGLAKTTTNVDCMGDPVHKATVDDPSPSPGFVEDFYGPSIDFSGSLYANMDAIKRDAAYALTTTAEGHGIESIEVTLEDIDEQDPNHGTVMIANQNVTTCPDWCPRSVSADAAKLTNIETGKYKVTATVTNEFDHSLSDNFNIWVDYPYFGYNEDWNNLAVQDPAPSPEPFALAKNTGANIERYAIQWNQLQLDGNSVDSNGVPNACAALPPKTSEDPTSAGHWEEYDAAYVELTNEQPCGDRDAALDPTEVAPLPRVVGAYDGYKQANCGDPPATGVTPRVLNTNSAKDAWQALVQNVAERYPLAAGIEVWNEENTPQYWGGCTIGASAEQRYEALLSRAHIAAANANPDDPIHVVTGGLAPGGGDDGEEANAYLQHILALNAGDVSEAVGLHPYWTQGNCSAGDRPEDSAETRVDDARTKVSDAGGSDPIWVTEVGVSTSAPSSDCRKNYLLNHYPGMTAESGQAQALVDTYDRLRNIDVPVVIVHRFIDATDQPTSDWKYGTGVVAANNARTTLTPKLACTSLAAERDRGVCSS
jgi:hypothetical protein